MKVHIHHSRLYLENVRYEKYDAMHYLYQIDATVINWCAETASVFCPYHSEILNSTRVDLRLYISSHRWQH